MGLRQALRSRVEGLSRSWLADASPQRKTRHQDESATLKPWILVMMAGLDLAPSRALIRA